MVYLSQGLHKADQAKGVAVLGVLDILPAIIGGPFFTAVFFDPNSTQTGEHNAARTLGPSPISSEVPRKASGNER